MNSDLDLVLYGNISRKDIMRLQTDFQESKLTLPVDIVAYHTIHDDALRAHMIEQ